VMAAAGNPAPRPVLAATPSGGCAVPASRRRGMTLLEVLLALSIVVMVGGAMLGTLYQGMRTATALRVEAQATDLAVTLLAELNLGIISPSAQGPESFAAPFEDWTWRLQFVEGDLAMLEASVVEAVVTHQPSGYVLRLAGAFIPEAAPDEFESPQFWDPVAGAIP
jgi:type II secretion system protein I